jgi:hypothetical protein
MAQSTYRFVQEVLQTRTVRDKLAEVADRKARAAQVIANAERVSVVVGREDGTRPKGRPYSYVIIPATHEWGDSKTRRLRILGRVVGL